MRNIQGLDHVVVLVHDLDDAETRLARLGFRPTPRGRHAAQMGTANTTVMFDDDTYVEMLAVVRPTGHNAEMRRALAGREGPSGLAFKTEDARAFAAEAAAAGIAAGDAFDFVRPVASAGGAKDAMFTIARLRPDVTPGAWLFVCQHHTPELVWRQDYLAQPNGTGGIAEVVGSAPDLDAVAAGWRQVFGAGLGREAERIIVEAGTARITFLTPAGLAERYGTLAASVGAGGEGDATTPSLAALRLRTSMLPALRRRLDQAGVVHATSAAGSVIVAPGEACGTLLEFSES